MGIPWYIQRPDLGKSGFRNVGFRERKDDVVVSDTYQIFSLFHVYFPLGSGMVTLSIRFWDMVFWSISFRDMVLGSIRFRDMFFCPLGPGICFLGPLGSEIWFFGPLGSGICFCVH